MIIDKTPEMVKNKVSFIMKITLNIMLALSMTGLILKILFKSNETLQNLADIILTIAVYAVAISPIVVVIAVVLFYILQRKLEGILLSLGLLLAIGVSVVISLLHKY